jgi:hypothetical protein
MSAVLSGWIGYGKFIGEGQDSCKKQLPVEDGCDKCALFRRDEAADADGAVFSVPCSRILARTPPFKTLRFDTVSLLACPNNDTQAELLHPTDTYIRK